MAKNQKNRWKSASVLQVGADSRRVWMFNAGKGGFVPDSELTVPNLAPLPGNLVGKDVRTLFQRKLNIALLPPEKVFLRVLHLPVSPFEELLSMVELQLEKISPLPVTQIVWTIHLLPHPMDNLQAVIVIIVERSIVQEFMGGLEGQGYLADRLETPMIDQLMATRVDVDGAWIYPSRDTGKFTALVAWWYGGELRNLGLVHIPPVENRGVLLEEQLRQMTWAGEIEGWLKSPPKWRLVADDVTVEAWRPMFQTWVDETIKVIPPLTPAEMATAAANRVVKSDPRASLLPLEYSTRYHQEFIDRLWIRGLGAVLGVYVLAVMAYFAWDSLQEYFTGQVEYQVRTQSMQYTNTLQLRDKLKVLQDRQTLKFASLNCWKAVAELLPEGITLQTFDFKNGRSMILRGSAPADQVSLVHEFNEKLRKFMDDGQQLFQKVDVAHTQLDPSRTTVSWDFSADLARGDDAP